MRRIIFLAILGLAGCGHSGPMTPQQAAILSAYMDRQTAINNAGMAAQSNLMSNYVNAVSRIGPSRAVSCNGFGGSWTCY